MGRPDRLPTDALIGVHVLVVDDDADARELFRTVLQYCGALVTTVGMATEALEALALVLPDVVVADIAMPDRDGYWLIAQIRALPPERGGDVPVLAVTGHGALHGADRTFAAGFQAYVRKPMEPWELCRQVAALVRRGDPNRPAPHLPDPLT
jgi:CheY-like chemotaxis protein